MCIVGCQDRCIMGCSSTSRVSSRGPVRVIVFQNRFIMECSSTSRVEFAKPCVCHRVPEQMYNRVKLEAMWVSYSTETANILVFSFNVT